MNEFLDSVLPKHKGYSDKEARVRIGEVGGMWWEMTKDNNEKPRDKLPAEFTLLDNEKAHSPSLYDSWLWFNSFPRQSS